MLVEIPDWLLEIGHQIRTQDNRCTNAPMFIVQEKRKVHNILEGHADAYEWIFFGEDRDSREATPLEKKRLDALDADHRDPPKGWEKRHHNYEWVFLQGCFTEVGCAEFLKREGHNLGETRIYGYGTFRNVEFQKIREFLMALPEPTTKPDEV